MNWAHCIHAQRVVEQHDDNTPGDAHVSVWASLFPLRNASAGDGQKRSRRVNASKNIRKATSLPRRPQVEGNGPFGIPKESRETRTYFSRDEESRRERAKDREPVFACVVFRRLKDHERVRGELLIRVDKRGVKDGFARTKHKTPLDKSLAGREESFYSKLSFSRKSEPRESSQVTFSPPNCTHLNIGHLTDISPHFAGAQHCTSGTSKFCRAKFLSKDTVAQEEMFSRTVVCGPFLSSFVWRVV